MIELTIETREKMHFTFRGENRRVDISGLFFELSVDEPLRTCPRELSPALRVAAMMGRFSCGRVALSIDLELELSQQSLPQHESLLQASSLLPEIVAAHQLQATWGVADPARSAARESILQSSPGQELAVLGQQHWVGNGRNPHFSRELARRFGNARRSGIDCRTLLLRSSARSIDLAPLVAAGVHAVRPASVCQLASADFETPLARHAVWVAPSAALVHPRGGWQLAAYLQLAWRLRTAARQRKLVSLAIDAALLAEQPAHSLEFIDKMLSLVSRHVLAGNLQCLTSGEMAREELASRRGCPAKSLLRSAEPAVRRSKVA